jgi:hypothetical protein
LTSVLVGGEWSGENPWYPLDRRLGGTRAGLDDVEKRKFFTLPGLKL